MSVRVWISRRSGSRVVVVVGRQPMRLWRGRLGGLDGEGRKVLIVVGGHDPPTTLNFRLLHANGAMNAVKLVVETTGVADGVAVIVASPQGGDGGAAVLACHDNTGRRGGTMAGTRAVLGVWVGRVVSVLRVALSMTLTISGLRECDLSSLGDSVVVGRTPVASIMATSTVAATTSWASSIRSRVGSHIGCSSSKTFGRDVAFRLSRLILRAWWTLRPALEVDWSHLVARLEI